MLYNFLNHLRFAPPNDKGSGDSESGGDNAQATQEKAKQTGMQFEDGSQRGGMEAPEPDRDSEIGEQLSKVEKLTNDKLEGGENGEPSGESEPESEPDESTQTESEEEAEAEEESGDQQVDEGTEAEGEEGEGEEGGEQAIFYDPERDVEGEAPHSNRFDTRDTAEEAAVNKAQMVQATIQDLKEEGIDTGAIPIPDQLEGDLEKLNDIANDIGNVIQWDDDQLRDFLTESDRFRQRLEARAERKRNERQTTQASQEFEQVQQKLVEDFDELGIDIENNEEAINAIDSGRDNAVEYLQNQIEEVANEAVQSEQEKLNEWLNSEEAENMTAAEVVEERDKWQQRIDRKKQEVRENWKPAIERMEKAYELAGKVNEKQSTQQSQQQMLENAYESFQEWQADRKGDLDVLNDDPAAKRELKSMKNWALNNLDKFNNLQNPRDWNNVPNEYRKYKKELRAKRQRKQVNGDTQGQSSRSKSGNRSQGGDQPRTPGDQSVLQRNREGDDHQKNEELMDDLMRKTQAKS